MKKLLYPFSGIAGLFFPVGKPEDDGTCEFYSEKCLLACAAIHCIDENAENKIIGHELKKAAYDFIVKENLFKVLYKITEELKVMKCNILYWFACGDCKKEHQERLMNIIEYLHKYGIVQCGFTRNKNFWEEVQKYTQYIALTLESYTEVQKTQRTGLFAIPDYKTNKVKIYRGEFHSGTCGMSVYSFKNIVRKANCLECYKLKQGCFYE